MSKYLLSALGVLALAAACGSDELPSQEGADCTLPAGSPDLVIYAYEGDTIDFTKEMAAPPGAEVSVCGGSSTLTASTAGDQDLLVTINDSGTIIQKKVTVATLTRPLSVNRVPFIELFTGADCPPCITADKGVDAVKAADPEGVGLLVWHMSIPGFDEWSIKELTANAEQPEWEREQGYLPADCCFTPFTILDGTTPTSDYVNFPTLIAASKADMVTYKVDVHGEMYGSTAIISVVVENLGSPVTMPLNVAIYENGIANKPGYVTLDSGGITEFNEVARKLELHAGSVDLVSGRNAFTYQIDAVNWFTPGTGQEVGAIAWLQKKVSPGQPDDGTTSYGGAAVYTRVVEQCGFGHLSAS